MTGRVSCSNGFRWRPVPVYVHGVSRCPEAMSYPSVYDRLQRLIERKCTEEGTYTGLVLGQVYVDEFGLPIKINTNLTSYLDPTQYTKSVYRGPLAHVGALENVFLLTSTREGVFVYENIHSIWDRTEEVSDFDMDAIIHRGVLISSLVVPRSDTVAPVYSRVTVRATDMDFLVVTVEPTVEGLLHVQDQCSLCLEHGSPVRTSLGCGHSFHADCIQSWLGGRGSTCPLCRGDASSVSALFT